MLARKKKTFTVLQEKITLEPGLRGRGIPVSPPVAIFFSHFYCCFSWKRTTAHGHNLYPSIIFVMDIFVFQNPDVELSPRVIKTTMP